MKKEGEFEGKGLEMPFFVHKYTKLTVRENDKFTAFTLFYRLDRDALYMVGGWRDRTIDKDLMPYAFINHWGL